MIERTYFIDAPHGDYRLRDDSPCLSLGMQAAVTRPFSETGST